ncbi:hypothetical protein DM02DRAFT_722625 [Periconia macrospinosa]|uniref:Uncharacterized protein n=1 Tax=Periconia macrospinosa TaxID=97972 RepID=A0A2V1EF38_9PLEO|nr:hypothetical protein DM02DRAFT_722625 [Periconia macrospinosa]
MDECTKPVEDMLCAKCLQYLEQGWAGRRQKLKIQKKRLKIPKKSFSKKHSNLQDANAAPRKRPKVSSNSPFLPSSTLQSGTAMAPSDNEPAEVMLARFKTWVRESEQEFNLGRMLALDRSMTDSAKGTIRNYRQGVLHAEFEETWFKFNELVVRQDPAVRARFQQKYEEF